MAPSFYHFREWVNFFFVPLNQNLWLANIVSFSPVGQLQYLYCKLRVQFIFSHEMMFPGYLLIIPYGIIVRLLLMLLLLIIMLFINASCLCVSFISKYIIHLSLTSQNSLATKILKRRKISSQPTHRPYLTLYSMF